MTLKPFLAAYTKDSSATVAATHMGGCGCVKGPRHRVHVLELPELPAMRDRVLAPQPPYGLQALFEAGPALGHVQPVGRVLLGQEGPAEADVQPTL